MKVEKERHLADEREGEGGGRGAESYDRKKAWPSINHSLLSATVKRDDKNACHAPRFCQDLALNIDTVCHRLSNMSKDIQLHAGIDKVLYSVHSS
jgi:hypothetical protein